MKYFACLTIGILIGVIVKSIVDKPRTVAVTLPEDSRHWYITNDSVVHLEGRDTLFVTKI